MRGPRRGRQRARGLVPRRRRRRVAQIRRGMEEGARQGRMLLRGRAGSRTGWLMAARAPRKGQQQQRSLHPPRCQCPSPSSPAAELPRARAPPQRRLAVWARRGAGWKGAPGPAAGRTQGAATGAGWAAGWARTVGWHPLLCSLPVCHPGPVARAQQGQHSRHWCPGSSSTSSTRCRWRRLLPCARRPRHSCASCSWLVGVQACRGVRARLSACTCPFSARCP